jgi:hypothetical protein
MQCCYDEFVLLTSHIHCLLSSVHCCAAENAFEAAGASCTKNDLTRSRVRAHATSYDTDVCNQTYILYNLQHFNVISISGVCYDCQ